MWSIFWSWAGRRLCAWAAIWTAADPGRRNAGVRGHAPPVAGPGGPGLSPGAAGDLFWNNLRQLIL